MGRRPPPPTPTDLPGLPGPVVRLVLDLWKWIVDAYTGDPHEHGPTHLLGGADPLQTPGTPTTTIINVPSAVGAGPSFATENHIHGINLGLAAKGDLLTHSGAAYVTRSQGAAADGTVLTKDAAEAAGMKWAAATGSGWTDDGTVVRLTTASDQVAIGTATPVGANRVTIAGGVNIQNAGNQVLYLLGLNGKFENASADAVGYQWTYLKSRAGGACSVGDVIGDLAWNFVNSFPHEYQGTVFRSAVVDPTDGAEATDIHFYVSTAGVVGLAMSLRGAGLGVGNVSVPHSKLQVAGPIAPAYASTAVDITLDNTHSTVAVDTSGGNRIITLPTAVGIPGRIYTVKRITAGANTLTVDGNGAETIDGAANVLLPNQWDVVRLQSNGANWIIV